MMRVLLLLLTVALGLPASAQDPTAPTTGPVDTLQPFTVPPVGLSDSARVSLLTMLPGDEVYSLFGHSAIRIRDDAAGMDRTYNFGTFSFDQPFFVVRFLRGSLDYMLDTAPFELELDKYAYLQRPIIEQTLDLDPETVRTFYDRLERNALPENRAYRYDFFWDNCSTRLLDGIDSALVASGRPGLALPPVEAPRTYRQLLAPYLVGQRAVETGLNLALGAPGDRDATAREEGFLPIELADQLDRATVGGRPLGASRDTLFWIEGAGMPAPAPRWPLWATIALAAVGIGLTALRRPPTRLGRLADAALFGVVGGMGVILFLLWVATTHDVMGPNWNLIWAWPTHLALAVAIGRDRVGPRWRTYLWATAGITGLAVLAWAVLPQRLPLEVLPVAVLLAVRAAVRARGNP